MKLFFVNFHAMFKSVFPNLWNIGERLNICGQKVNLMHKLFELFYEAIFFFLSWKFLVQSSALGYQKFSQSEKRKINNLAVSS